MKSWMLFAHCLITGDRNLEATKSQQFLGKSTPSLPGH